MEEVRALADLAMEAVEILEEGASLVAVGVGGKVVGLEVLVAVEVADSLGKVVGVVLVEGVETAQATAVVATAVAMAVAAMEAVV